MEHQDAPEDIDQLIEFVVEAFSQMPLKKLDAVFLLLKEVMESAMSFESDSSYCVQHIKKEPLCHENGLPVTLVCSEQSITKAKLALAGFKSEQ